MAGVPAGRGDDRRFHPSSHLVALTSEQLAGFTSPIAERTDHDMYLRVFQQRNGQWFQCKTWISRQFFF